VPVEDEMKVGKRSKADRWKSGVFDLYCFIAIPSTSWHTDQPGVVNFGVKE
jgi:hypothetical protein